MSTTKWSVLPPSHWSCIVSPAICSVIFVGPAFSTPLRRGLSFSRSCIFQPCDLVRHFPGPASYSPAIWSVIFQFLHFPALRIGPSFSRSCIVQVLHFQSPRRQEVRPGVPVHTFVLALADLNRLFDPSGLAGLTGLTHSSEEGVRWRRNVNF